MKITSLSARAGAFEFKHGSLNPDGLRLPLATADGVRIRAIELDGWLRVMIEVDEDATHQTLRKALPLALRWRDVLLEEQGPWMSGGRNLLLLRLADIGSPAAGARMLNKKLADLLREHLDYLRERDEARPRLRTWDDWLEWRPKANQFSFVHARDLLCELGFSRPEAEGVLQEALERIRNGQRPFRSSNDPFTRARVERIIRTWRDGKKGKAADRIFQAQYPEIHRALTLYRRAARSTPPPRPAQGDRPQGR